MSPKIEVSTKYHRFTLIVLTLITASYCAWVLSLPLFPTQDGPMHLYFTNVLHELLTHNARFYEHYYYVRHVLPPYALYYYTLMFFSTFLPVLLADKVIICLYFLCFTFGFRYLALAIGRDGDIAALFSTLLLLNWPLGMGFINFCLSMSFGLWALGLWCRAVARRGQDRQDHIRLILFVLLSYVIMLTHPVPLLLVLGFCGVELIIRIVRQRKIQTHWVTSMLYLIAASGTLVYVKLFTTHNVLQQVHISPEAFWPHEISLLKGYVLLHSLNVFAGRSLVDTFYRLIFYALLPACLFLGVRRSIRAWRAGTWEVGETWTLVAVGFLLIFPLIPSDLNNSAYFSARLVIFIWIAALLSASGSEIRNGSVSVVLALMVVVCTGLILSIAQMRIAPIARDVARIEQMHALPENGVGLLMHSLDYHYPTSITYDPYFWSAARMFRRTDSVIYNTPWLDLPIIPLGPQPIMPTYKLSANVLEYPPGLRKVMENSEDQRIAILSGVRFAIFNSGVTAKPGKTDELLVESRREGAAAPSWTCEWAAPYNVCFEESASLTGYAQAY